MALIHHLALGVESNVPDRTVSIWQRSGWAEGPLPTSVEVEDEPLDVEPVVEFADPSVDESTRL